MSDAEGVKFSLKVTMNKKKTKVLFAEVDGDIADILLSILTLPLGTIVRLLKKRNGDEAPVFGSLTTLYKGLANLDNVHFWTEAGKLMLLNPRNSFQDQCSKLKLNIDDAHPTKYFKCEDTNNFTSDIPRCRGSRYLNVCMYYDSGRCPDCGKTMNKEVCTMKAKTEAADGDEVFTIKPVSFLISHDTRMLLPNDAASLIQAFSNLGITDINGAEQTTVTVGFNEIVEGSLFSGTLLTDLILHKRLKTGSAVTKSEPGVMDQIEEKETFRTESERKMILKVIVQKSTNKFLFAQAEQDFVDFLFSFLTIPVAGVEKLLGSNSCLTNIDNLYKSSANLNKYLRTTENNLFNPKLPPMYLSKSQIFPLSEQKLPESYFSKLAIIDPKGQQGSYVKGPGTYMVTNDLTVTPMTMSVSSTLSIISGMKIQLCDVKELEFEIGLEEGLSILKASLTSACALSNGLNSILRKQPKQEKSVCCSWNWVSERLQYFVFCIFFCITLKFVVCVS